MKLATPQEMVTIPLHDTGSALTLLRRVIHQAKPEHYTECLTILEQLKAYLWGKVMVPAQLQENDPLLTASQVAEKLQLSTYRVYELCRQGQLKSSRLGKAVRIRLSAVQAYVNQV